MKLPKHFSSITSDADFEQIALDTFRFQHEHVAVYQKFCDLLKVAVPKVQKITEIPFLPIQFFKSEDVIVSNKKPETVFTSSGTTGSQPSRHLVADVQRYEESFLKTFQQFYGNISDYAILALLPSYLEKEGSSLIYMVNTLIEKNNHPDSGFYLNNLDELLIKLKRLEVKKQKTLLLGVSYALLDLIEKETLNLKNTIVMETGGMKGRRKEMIKAQLHSLLNKGFGTTQIHSEYGMTELLSQAYSKEKGIFSCPPWMKVLTRDTEDPFTYVNGKTGGVNVIDLANTYSCSFIATQDLGKVLPDGNFEIMGRFDNSDIRGCNLMVL